MPSPAEIAPLIALYNAGSYTELESRTRLLVDQYPDFGTGWKLLGGALKMQGKNALPVFLKVAELMPDDAGVHSNLGTALYEVGQLDDALRSFRRAMKLKPDSAASHFNLGKILKELGKFDEAVTCYRKAIKIQPDYAIAYYNLGNALKDLGRLDDAVLNYRLTVAIKPDFAEAHYNLGHTLKDIGQVDNAVISYRRALELKNDFAEAHNNIAIALQEQGRFDETIEHCRQALALKPDYAEANSNLGNALKDQGKLDEAVAYFQKALSFKPDFAEAIYNLGNTLKEQGKLDEAIKHYRKALSLEPAYVMAHGNLLFAMNFHTDLSAEEIYRTSREYDALIGIPLRSTWRAHRNNKNPDRRLRVGYVSPDFRNHAVAYFAEPILANHDKSQVEIFCYSEVRHEDEYTGRFRQMADHWHSTVGMNDDTAAKMIRDHQIDILVDLAGHSAGNRLLMFARKPAPIQLTYLGYPGTTGLSAMDYRITDHHAEPEGIADAFYAERLLRLPGSLWCYRPSADMPEVSPLPALARGYLTFGSFNNFNKIDQPTLNLWAELLRALPTSRLMMLTVPEGETRLRLLRSFAELGINAGRLEFYGKLSLAEFHRKFLEVDITLDPVTVNGATTTCESLWMGVPVISLVGTRFLTRAGLSILNTAGLSEFSAASHEDYIRIAAHLADNLPPLAEIRAGLRAHVAASPLIDEVGFTRNLENLYREIWGKWCGAT